MRDGPDRCHEVLFGGLLSVCDREHKGLIRNRASALLNGGKQISGVQETRLIFFDYSIRRRPPPPVHCAAVRRDPPPRAQRVWSLLSVTVYRQSVAQTFSR